MGRPRKVENLNINTDDEIAKIEEQIKKLQEKKKMILMKKDEEILNIIKEKGLSKEELIELLNK